MLLVFWARISEQHLPAYGDARNGNSITKKRSMVKSCVTVRFDAKAPATTALALAMRVNRV